MGKRGFAWLGALVTVVMYIMCTALFIGFAHVRARHKYVSEALRAIEAERTLELAQARRDSYAEGYRNGYAAGTGDKEKFAQWERELEELRERSGR